MLKIYYTSIVILINIVYYVAFGLIIRDLGLEKSDEVIYTGALALLFFNGITFLVSLYFFKNATLRFKLFNRLLYGVLVAVPLFPLLYSVVAKLF